MSVGAVAHQQLLWHDVYSSRRRLELLSAVELIAETSFEFSLVLCTLDRAFAFEVSGILRHWSGELRISIGSFGTVCHLLTANNAL
jgi:hypothetical protein